VVKQKTVHKENIVALKRIEGQIKGIQRMVNDEKYCIDIVTQLQAAINALYRVSEKIFFKHIGHCVYDAFRGESERGKLEKLEEVMHVIQKLHKSK